MMYRTPSVFVVTSSTDSGSWPVANGLARTVSLTSLGNELRRVWLSAKKLLAVVMWCRMVSMDGEDASFGAMCVLDGKWDDREIKDSRM
jgi:hypothetical protein